MGRSWLIALSLMLPLMVKAQTYPAPTTPLAGTEVTPCVQGHGYKSCTSANIAALATAPAGHALPHVPNNTALAALAHTTYALVVRDGYAAAGDAPPLVYNPSASPCSAADNGACTNSSDGGSWLANFPSGPYDVREWGAKCDGSTNDATTVNAALSAVGTIGSGTVTLPLGRSCKVSSTLTIPPHVSLAGNGPAAGDGGLRVGATNLSPAIQFGGDGSTLTNVYINAGAAGTNTSGAVVAFGLHFNTYFTNSEVDGACVGATIDGNTVYMDRVTFNAVANGVNCGGWIVGDLSTHAGTVDPAITNNTVGGATGSGAGFGQRLLDVGGLYEANDNLLFAGNGTQIIPGANQEVDWAFIASSALGDTNGTAALFIQPQAASAIVKGFSCVQCWTASEQSGASADILIDNSNSGTIDGLYFIGHRDFNSAGNAAAITGGKNIFFQSSHFCGSKSGSPVITVATGITGFHLLGGNVGGACAGHTTTPSVGITFGGTSPDALIGNDVDFTGVTTAVSNMQQLFSALPASPFVGMRSYITDDNSACTFGTIATGAGSTKCPVVWNGTNWVAG